MAASTAAVDEQSFDFLIKFFLALSAAVILTVVAGLIKESRTISRARAIHREIEDLLPKGSVGSPRSKEQFLARMDLNEKRMMAGEVHYISELIKSSNSNLDDIHRLAAVIVRESRKANYDPIFVAAVIKSESTFKRHAVSSTGAMGLMQLMPSTAEYISAKGSVSWSGQHQLKDPSYNIQLGIAYLKYLERLFAGDKSKMLIAYNWGPGNLIDAVKHRKPVLESASLYAKKILTNHTKWRSDFATKVAQYQYLNVDKYLG